VCHRACRSGLDAEGLWGPLFLLWPAFCLPFWQTEVGKMDYPVPDDIRKQLLENPVQVRCGMRTLMAPSPPCALVASLALSYGACTAKCACGRASLCVCVLCSAVHMSALSRLLCDVRMFCNVFPLRRAALAGVPAAPGFPLQATPGGRRQRTSLTRWSGQVRHR
jgi:hypothetical protein